MKYFLSWFLLIPLFLFLPFKLASQQNLIGSKTPVKYFPAVDSAPGVNWYQINFNDIEWATDTLEIGYGEEVDVEISPNAKSLYLRYRFFVDDIESIHGISFMGDFDDGYIAYLNGKEVLRKNVADSIRFSSYNSLASRSHEKETGTKYPVYGFYIAPEVADTCVQEGENLLAVHVLNDSVNGSDLFFRLYMYNMYPGNYDIYGHNSRYIRKWPVDSVNFPLVIIETNEFGIPYKNIRVPAKMGIIDNGPGNYNSPSDSCNVFSGMVDIEVRGQSSSQFPKRSYRFELKDAHGGDSNVVILGMPPDDDWILFGPFQDRSQFRNKMIFDLARNFGRYQPRSEFCEVILNGEFMGLYAITETIKQLDSRVDVARLRKSETTGIDVTGGYILKYDKPSGFQIHYPKPDDIQGEQTAYINSYMKEYNKVLFSDGFWDPDSGYRRFINDTSLIDHMIMTEFCKNADGYFISTYFYKDRADRDDRLHYGPLWDHDLVFGNTRFQDGYRTDGWQFEYPDNGRYIKIKRFLQDEEFVSLFQERYHMARNSFLSDESVFGFIDSMALYLSEAVARNYEVWPVMGEEIFFSNYIPVSYEDEIYQMSQWLEQRLAWLDENIDDLYYEPVYYPDYLDGITGENFTFDVFPNPFTNETKIALTSTQSIPVTLSIYSLTGQLIFEKRYTVESGYNNFPFESENLESMTPGIYVLQLSSMGRHIAHKKIVKQR